jgi:hypothetical protein
MTKIMLRIFKSNLPKSQEFCQIRIIYAFFIASLHFYGDVINTNFIITNILTTITESH